MKTRQRPIVPPLPPRCNSNNTTINQRRKHYKGTRGRCDGRQMSAAMHTAAIDFPRDRPRRALLSSTSGQQVAALSAHSASSTSLTQQNHGARLRCRCGYSTAQRGTARRSAHSQCSKERLLRCSQSVCRTPLLFHGLPLRDNVSLRGTSDTASLQNSAMCIYSWCCGDAITGSKLFLMKHEHV